MFDEKSMVLLQESIRKATEKELVQFENLREKVRNNMKPIRLGQRHLHTIAPVATDGGDNRLSLEPINIELIRVADSEGTKHVDEIIPLSTEVEVFRTLFDEIPILNRLLDRLHIEYEDVSFLLPHAPTDPSKENVEISSRDYARILRDIIEWAVLLDLAHTRNSLLLLRDGLLRTKSMKRETVKKMASSFQEAYHERNILLLGVAKRSKVLNYLSLALSLEGVFHNNHVCFCEVPEDIEKESYNWARTWQKGDQVFGRMHLVKLVPIKRGIVLPVDVPFWLMENRKRKEALEYLAGTADTSFPLVGYPYPLVKAHDNAVLKGLEIDIIASLVERALISLHGDDEQERVIELLYLTKGLQIGGWKEYG